MTAVNPMRDPAKLGRDAPEKRAEQILHLPRSRKRLCGGAFQRSTLSSGACEDGKMKSPIPECCVVGNVGLRMTDNSLFYDQKNMSNA